MNGIELSRGFYDDVVRQWLGRTVPNLRHSAALLNYGSELLGFDDEVSRDHNWGPRVLIFISSEDFARHARRLVGEFSRVAPTSYRGEPIGWRSRPNSPADGHESAGAMEHGLEVHTLEAYLQGHFAMQSVDTLTPIQWLGFPEQKLLTFTSGAIFRDDGNRLGKARERLGYYPDDVWLYKIACQWRRIAEEQAFVGRAGQVGDDMGSRIVAARLARDVMRMGFLLERRYAPYSKWLGSAFAQLAIAKPLAPRLENALRADDWMARGAALASAYLELANWQNSLGFAKFEPVVGPYHDRPFTTINADDAISAAQSAISDEAIRNLPIIGSIDQISDLTPVLEDAGRAQAIMDRLQA